MSDMSKIPFIIYECSHLIGCTKQAQLSGGKFEMDRSRCAHAVTLCKQNVCVVRFVPPNQITLQISPANHIAVIEPNSDIWCKLQDSLL